MTVLAASIDALSTAVGIPLSVALFAVLIAIDRRSLLERPTRWFLVAAAVVLLVVLGGVLLIRFIELGPS
jgi:hypothetical protein